MTQQPKTTKKLVQQEPSKMEIVTKKDESKDLVAAAEVDKGLRDYFGGVCDESIAGYFNQALKTHPNVYLENKNDTTGQVMGSVMGIKPKGDIEFMLATQAVGVHNLSMEMMSRAASADRIRSIDSAVNQATKLSRTFVALIEALNKHRGKGQQKITVEHVTVNEGGQAIVGNVQEGGRDGKK